MPLAGLAEQAAELVLFTYRCAFGRAPELSPPELADYSKPFAGAYLVIFDVQAALDFTWIHPLG